MTEQLFPLPYGAMIGIIGGGQLGRMLAMAAARLGYHVTVLDPAEDCPAAECASRQIIANYDDETALAELAQKCAMITYEFENVPVRPLLSLPPEKLSPSPEALRIAQDRLVEKNFLNDHDVKTAPFRDIKTENDVAEAFEALGAGILKTRRLGYDGKGQARIKTRADIAQGFADMARQDAIYEQFIPFSREISVIAARGRDGDVSIYAPGENVHLDGILHTTTIPAQIDQATVGMALESANRILNALDYMGVIGIEFFVLEDGTLIANEFAPRVHNSGHWTEAACAVSQFEQHIRAITGQPLGNGAHHSNAVMENLIGADIEKVPDILAEPASHLHLYGKRDVKAGRKMGHVTRLFPRH